MKMRMKMKNLMLIVLLCLVLSGCTAINSFLEKTPPEDITSAVSSVSAQMNAVLPWSGTVFSLLVSGLLFIRNRKQGKKVLSLYNGTEDVFQEIFNAGSDSEKPMTGAQLAELVKETMKANAIAYSTYEIIKKELTEMRKVGKVT